MKKEELDQFVKELPDYKEPDVDMAEYDAEIKRIGGNCWLYPSNPITSQYSSFYP